MWLPLALVTCLLWAVVFVLDAHCVGRVFTRPWVGVVVSAAFVAAVLPAGAVALAFLGWQGTSWPVAAAACLAGAVFVGSQAAYFQALRYTESGVVAAYLNMTAVAVPVVGHVAFGEALTAPVYCGVGVLVGASALLCLLDVTPRGWWSAFGLMAAVCVCQSAYYLLVKAVFDRCPVPTAVFLVLTGVAATGLSPLLLATARRTVRENIPGLRAALGLLVLIETFHLLALVAGQAAVDAGRPTLVVAVESVTPAVTFLLSVGLFAVFGQFGEPGASRRLPAKLALVGVMAVGVWLVSSGGGP